MGNSFEAQQADRQGDADAAAEMYDADDGVYDYADTERDRDQPVRGRCDDGRCDGTDRQY